MKDVTIKGRRIKIIMASGVFGYGDLSINLENIPYLYKRIFIMPDLVDAVVTKTLMLNSEKGNLGLNLFEIIKSASRVIKSIDNDGNIVTPYFGDTGICNAVALSSKGLLWWMKEYYPKIKWPEKIIVSFAGKNENELIRVVEILNGLNVFGIEPNFTCPNHTCGTGWMNNDDATIEAMIKICELSKHPVFLKLSIKQDYKKIARALEGHVVAISINSLPWDYIFPNKKSPLHKFGGGAVSGEASHRIIYAMLRELKATTKTPLIGQSWRLGDVEILEEMNIPIIGIGSNSIFHPREARKIIKKVQIT